MRFGVTDFLTPDWSAPPNVRALFTTRRDGTSNAPWDSFNLGDHVGDNPAHVARNRDELSKQLPASPVWLRQVHGTRCVDAAAVTAGTEADAAIARRNGVVCAVLTADCLPVLLCDESGTVVGCAHAGWRGLADGVIESTVAAMGTPGNQLMAWLGPAIGPTAFEVGDEVRASFLAQDTAAGDAFIAGRPGKWLCDIYLLARQRLAALGVRRIASTDFCTHRDRDLFFSYRRDGVTGRMASLIWLE
jgi:YfiH family protein